MLQRTIPLSLCNVTGDKPANVTGLIADLPQGIRMTVSMSWANVYVSIFLDSNFECHRINGSMLNMQVIKHKLNGKK